MTIKSFYIRRRSGMTDAQVAEVFDKAVAAGAIYGNGVSGHHSAEQCKDGLYRPEWFSYFGVSKYNETWISDRAGLFDEEITLDQVDEWLGIKKEPTVAERMVTAKPDEPCWDQEMMILRDRGIRSKVENDYLARTALEFFTKELSDKPKELTIPSICLAEPSSHMMMLGGDFGGAR